MLDFKLLEAKNKKSQEKNQNKPFFFSTIFKKWIFLPTTKTKNVDVYLIKNKNERNKRGKKKFQVRGNTLRRLIGDD